MFRTISRPLDHAFLGDEAGVEFSINGGLVVNGYSESEASVLWSQAIRNDLAKQLGIPMTPDLMQLGSNEAISNALVEIAVGMGKTEEEIGAALG